MPRKRYSSLSNPCDFLWYVCIRFSIHSRMFFFLYLFDKSISVLCTLRRDVYHVQIRYEYRSIGEILLIVYTFDD